VFDSAEFGAGAMIRGDDGRQLLALEREMATWGATVSILPSHPALIGRDGSGSSTPSINDSLIERDSRCDPGRVVGCNPSLLDTEMLERRLTTRGLLGGREEKFGANLVRGRIGEG